MELEKVLLWGFLLTSVFINIIYLISVYKESYRKSFEDPLTKVSNRKFLEEEITKFVNFGGDKYEVIFCDIDHFKKVNDTYGHDAGDKVLEIVGQKLKANFKEGKDHTIRYGGEEFILLIYKESDKNIRQPIIDRVEKFRQAIEDTILNIQGKEIKFTMSFGICFYDSKISFKEQLKKADEALYHSKNNGRNQLTIHEEA